MTILMAIALPMASGFATPPVSITLSYDLDKGILHVEAVHPSYNLEKSYVRLMEVYLNGANVSKVDYFKQNDYNEFTDDVSLKAQAGDVIKVDLFCSEGGEMAKELTVAKPGETPPQEDTDAAAESNATAN